MYAFGLVHLLDELLPVSADDGLLVNLLFLHERIAEMVLQHLVKRSGGSGRGDEQ